MASRLSILSNYSNTSPEQYLLLKILHHIQADLIRPSLPNVC